MAVAREQVVVVALEQVSLADGERRGLAAEAGPALVHVARVSGFGEPVPGDEAGNAGPDHGDPHRDVAAVEVLLRLHEVQAAAA